MKNILIPRICALVLVAGLAACGGNATVPENHFYRLEVAGPETPGKRLISGVLEVDRLLLLEEGHCLRDQALALCEQKPKRAIVNVGATSMTTLLQMVANDMGMTLIPEMAVAAETARTPLTILPFAEPQPARRIGLCWRRSDRRRDSMEALSAAVLACRAG